MTELPTYLAKADAVDPQMDVLEWWVDRRFAQLVLCSKKVVPTQPSSGVVERFFFTSEPSFGDSQEKALEYYVEASIMLQYMNVKLSPF